MKVGNLLWSHDVDKRHGMLFNSQSLVFDETWALVILCYFRSFATTVCCTVCGGVSPQSQPKSMELGEFGMNASKTSHKIEETKPHIHKQCSPYINTAWLCVCVCVDVSTVSVGPACCNSVLKSLAQVQCDNVGTVDEHHIVNRWVCVCHIVFHVPLLLFVRRQSGARTQCLCECVWFFTSICGAHRYVFMSLCARASVLLRSILIKCNAIRV